MAACEHFATLFDAAFLPQGLALHASLERHCRRPFCLHVLCMDDAAFDALTKLGVAEIRPMRLAEVWNDDVESASRDRSHGEMCWTLTPALIAAVLACEGVERVTYVDADMWFLQDPVILFEGFERSGRAVQVTLHGFGPDYDTSALYGRFCVQFLTFKKAGQAVLEQWRRDCLDWCYGRMEEDRFGDQKYLDRWNAQFPGMIHVFDRPEMLQAPWNATRFAHSEAVAFHFHGLRFLGANKVLAYRGYSIPLSVQRAVYEAYLRDLAVAIESLHAAGIEVRRQAKRLSPWQVAGVLIRKLQRAWGKWRPYRVMVLRSAINGK